MNLVSLRARFDYNLNCLLPFRSFAISRTRGPLANFDTEKLVMLRRDTSKIVIWNAQGVPQSNNAAHPKHRKHYIITSTIDNSNVKCLLGRVGGGGSRFWTTSLYGLFPEGEVT